MNRRFYAVLANTFVASTTTTLVWFAITFWVYLQTKSVLATSSMAGIFLVTVALSGFLLGSVVDRHRKKTAMMISSSVSLIFFSLTMVIYLLAPEDSFVSASDPYLWLMIVFSLAGAIAGNLRGIALSTLVTILAPAGERDRANGMVGSTTGAGFLVASILSGLLIGYAGVEWMLAAAIVLSVAVLVHLALLKIPEDVHPAERLRAAGAAGANEDATAGEGAGRVDLRGTLRLVLLIPGLLGLIFFNTFNNLLGGVFFALMDAYGLQLVSVQVWGTLWGVLSLGFIVGGLIVARRGLGANPLRSMLLTNVVLWVITIIFPMQPSIVLLTIGMAIYLCLVPVIEAAEQTILQKVIPLERQGRVFGFAQSIEQSASPAMAFIIGPIAQFIFIPYMTTGAGVELIGDWFGVGPGRGIALLFVLTAVVGLAMTLLALRSRAYRSLSAYYMEVPVESDETAPGPSTIPLPVPIAD